jgi:hypothetical protein
MARDRSAGVRSQQEVDGKSRKVDEQGGNRTKDSHRATNCIWRTAKSIPHWCGMALLVTFLLGIGNFAFHGAIIECRHPLLRSLPPAIRILGGRASLVAEFVVLLAALLLVAYGHTMWGWAYLGYTLFNGLAAWLILSHRI